jgi:hypothetical protein
MRSDVINLIGQKFGRWTAVSYAGHCKWLCICACGTRRAVEGKALRKGASRSCGCANHEPRIDLSGKSFGRLVVISYARNGRWLCVCACGTPHEVNGKHLRRGDVQSCGCLARELTSVRSRRHGLTRSPTYRSWEAMKSRCLNRHNVSYKNYGAIGITFFPDWHAFIPFLEYAGERPPGKSLDRANPFGHYWPGNIGWATASEQQRNKRRARARMVKRVPPPDDDDPPF